MPPKNAKKQAVARPDNSGIPKQDVEFSFTFSVKSSQSDLPYAIMFQWFGSTSDKRQRTDTTIIQSWQKSQDGYKLEKTFDLIRVDDDFCKSLSSQTFFVYFVNAEDNKVLHILNLDYSSLLASKPEQNPTFNFSTSTVKIMGIDDFTMKITANKELLQDMYRHYLNPFEIEVIGVKDVPIDSFSKYQPAYVCYEFFDHNKVETHCVVGRDKLLFNHKHVLLLGLMDVLDLKEKLRSCYMKFELHDRDELENKKIKEDIPLFNLTKAIEQQLEKEKPVENDPKKKGKKEEKKQAPKQAKKQQKKKDFKLGEPVLPEKVSYIRNNYGISAFYLADFLKPSMRTTTYKSPVVPKNTFEDFESRNIDLNTTARNQMQKILVSSSYFENDTQMAVSFTISHPIGTFVKPEPVQPVVEETKKTKKQLPTQKKLEPKEEEEEKESLKDLFERVIYLIPYKDSETIEKIEKVFYDVNMKVFNLKNRRQIATYLLNKEEKQNNQLDYMTGIQLIDPEGRLYILEGLKQGAMKKINQVMVKKAVNKKTFKILKNSNLTFTKRLYSDFNIQLKRIRFRPSLIQVLLDPSVYIKSKIPEEISQNLNIIIDLRKLCDDLKTVETMNLWPTTSALIQIQRKFSDSLSYMDVYGEQQVHRKRKGQMKSETKQKKNLALMQSPQLTYVGTEDFSLPKIKQSYSEHSKSVPNIKTKMFVKTKKFNEDEMKNIELYKKRLRKTGVNESEQVFIYSGQKNNWYEKQMKDLREQLQNEKGKSIYTFSQDHFGLTLQPKSKEQLLLEEKLASQNKNISKKKFSSLIVQTHEERMRLPKQLGDEDIENLRKYPYKDEKKRQKEMLKNTRDMPLHSSSKPEFHKYLKKSKYFDEPEVIQGEQMSPEERFQKQQEERKRIRDENRNQMLGNQTMKVKKGYISDKVIGLDKYKGILQNQAVKKGIIDVHKRTNQKRTIMDYEVSYELNEKRISPGFESLARKHDSNLNMGKYEFNNYQRPEVITKSSITKPLKKAHF